MSLPTTLHGQLYLLSLDRRRRAEHRDPILAGMALRAAMLTDLYLSGNITDRGGTPHPVDRAQPVDPVLRAALRRIGSGEYPSWAAAIAPDPKRAVAAVRDQLRSAACIHVGRAIPCLTTPRVTLSDETSIEALAERVRHAVHSAINGTPAEPTRWPSGCSASWGSCPGCSVTTTNPATARASRRWSRSPSSRSWACTRRSCSTSRRCGPAVCSCEQRVCPRAPQPASLRCAPWRLTSCRSGSD